MSTPSSRLFRLLTLLQSRRYWTGPELADRLDVSARTLRRDVERLRDLGYPVEAARGVDGGYHLAPGASLPPLAVDDEEAVALAIGLRAVAGTMTGMEQSAIRALGKVMQVMPARLRRRVDALQEVTEAGPGVGGPAVDALVLTDLAESCQSEVRVSFAYTAADGTRTERDVEPHRLVSHGRRWYLVCYDVDRRDWRSFRLDRISDVVRTDRRFRPRPLPADDAATFVAEGFDRLAASTRTTVRVRVAAPAEVVAAVVRRWGEVEARGAEHCELRMVVDPGDRGLDWAVFALGSVDADFEVIEPPALTDALARWADRFTRAVQRTARG
ncbi:helix-turn-helix transcriptional regulator [Euzebya sp.]|uniref:helix-turn-helix transcriptional regulator n=1 Tax=Euzebya sp. TaxID=1971409 RepID=UPI0035123D4D